MRLKLLLAAIAVCLTMAAEPISQELAEIQTRSITSALKLSPETAKKFAPIYVDYLSALGKASEKYAEPKVNEYSSDIDIEKAIQARFALARKTLEIRETYFAKFRQILTPRQLNSLYKNERLYQSKIQRESKRRTASSASSFKSIPSNIRQPITTYMKRRLPTITQFAVVRANSRSDCYLRHNDNLIIVFDRHGKFKEIKTRLQSEHIDFKYVESVLNGFDLKSLKPYHGNINSISRKGSNKYEISFNNTSKKTVLSH